ncbi:MAG TPA: hypothetical protein VGI24_07585 [Solirubrobacteraceae bacterium]
MTENVIIKNLRKAADRRVSAEAERHAATQELRRRVQEARAAGLGPTQIAREAALSRQAIYEMLGESPSSQR